MFLFKFKVDGIGRDQLLVRASLTDKVTARMLINFINLLVTYSSYNHGRQARQVTVILAGSFLLLKNFLTCISYLGTYTHEYVRTLN